MGYLLHNQLTYDVITCLNSRDFNLGLKLPQESYAALTHERERDETFPENVPSQHNHSHIFCLTEQLFDVYKCECFLDRYEFFKIIFKGAKLGYA